MRTPDTSEPGSDSDTQEPTTERLPKTGLRVPVPERADVMAAIAKVSRPEPDEDQSDES